MNSTFPFEPLAVYKRYRIFAQQKTITLYAST